MNTSTLISLSELFHKLATSNLKSILSKLENIESYSKRKEIAENNLEHISSGSSRIVYKTSNNTIIKLAKNDKGIQQNKTEANPKMISKFLNKIINHAENYSWIQTYYLDKINQKDFKNLTNFNFKDFGNAIQFGLQNIKEKPKNFDKIKDSEIYKEMIRLAKTFKLIPGDIIKISSWGAKNNIPILIDAGLTKLIFQKYYKSHSSSKL